MAYHNTNLIAQTRRVLVDAGTYALVIAGDVHVALDVQHAGATARGPTHRVSARLENSGGRPYVADGLVIEATPPLPPYRDPTKEPDDNSLAARSARFAELSVSASADVTFLQIWTVAYIFWTLWPEQEYFSLAASEADTWRVPLLLSGLGVEHPAAGRTNGPTGTSSRVLVSRAAFWQGAGPRNAGKWAPVLDSMADLAPRPFEPTPYSAAADGVRVRTLHPARMPKIGAWDPASPEARTTPMYRRYIPALRQTLTYRLASSKSAQDVDLIHRWHASDRVSAGWRQNLSRNDHAKYLETIEKSSDQMALIGEWDGDPWGYVEVYWSKESPLHAYYPAGDYDRGFHILVGEDKYRGPARVRSWMGSLAHLIFLLDDRTMSSLAEPRASNTKAVDYISMLGGHVHSLIDLPHKRAALILIPRQRFFQLCPLEPLVEN